MATPVKNIEKEILLKIIFDEKIPVIYYKDRVEYEFMLKKPAGEDMLFEVNQPIEKLKVKDRIDLTFEYQGKPVAFIAEVVQKKEQEITCAIPDYFYKDLDRSYSRVSIPAQMQVNFTFLGDRYDLSFPKLPEYSTEDLGHIFQDDDIKNLSGLIVQMSTWIKTFASNYRLVIFKDVKPSTTEERIIAETGRALFLPSTHEGFPLSDPFPRKRIITEDVFKRYLESTGIGVAFIDSACARFIKAKTESSIFSDAWIPILFHEYVIGYVHIWIDVADKPPLDYEIINTLFQLTKVLAYSLKINGYFEKGKLKNDPFEGRVIDISASGLLFAYPVSANISSVLKPDSKLTVKITTPERSITTEARIVRRFKDKTIGYYGCRFDKMEDEEHNYLFQFIYGKPFTDADSEFL
jgi:c-di-GMP-binding flagellar brake protein YcgR